MQEVLTVLTPLGWPRFCLNAYRFWACETFNASKKIFGLTQKPMTNLGFLDEFTLSFYRLTVHCHAAFPIGKYNVLLHSAPAVIINDNLCIWS